jgi:tetratricopeptide (TPR) repeat protein
LADGNHSYARQRFGRICTEYDEARARVTFALTKYEEARQHFDSTRMGGDEPQQHFDRIRNDYDKERKHLDHIRTKYNEARHDLDSVHMEYHEARQRFDRAFIDYDHGRHHSADHNMYHHRIRKTWDHTLINYDEAQQRYDDVVQSIDKSYQVQNKSCAANSEENSQPLSQEYMKALDSAKKLCIMAHQSLKHCDNENVRIERHLKEARDSLKHEMNETQEALQYYESALSASRHSEQVSSSEIHHAEALLRQEHKKQSSKKSREFACNDDQGDIDIVRRIIAQQKFDGLWNVDTKFMEELTGKSLSEFQQPTNIEVLISAIIIIVLETRFASLSSMWYGVVQKARKRLLDMFDKDNKEFNTLLEDIRKQL